MIGCLVFVAGLCGFASVEMGWPYATKIAAKAHFPGRGFAEEIRGRWRERYRQPLRYVIGDTRTGGNIAYFTPERPHLLIDGNYEISPWIDPEEVRKRGAVIVWCMSDCGVANEPADLRSEFPTAEVQPALTLARETIMPEPPATIGWAILAPAKARP